MFISEEEWKRFFDLRQQLFDLIKKVDDGYHKSYEGAMDVRFCFDNIYESNSINDIDSIEIELHCYLLVNGRHITWKGKTFKETTDKFERWLEEVKRVEDESDWRINEGCPE